MNEQDIQPENATEKAITELILKLQEQRAILGDDFIRMTLRFALKASRMKVKDKKKHDEIISQHQALQEFCKEIGLKI